MNPEIIIIIIIIIGRKITGVPPSPMLLSLAVDAWNC